MSIFCTDSTSLQGRVYRVTSHDDLNVRARGPHLVGFLAVPAPLEHVLARGQASGHADEVHNFQVREQRAPIGEAGALAHSRLLDPRPRRVRAKAQKVILLASRTLHRVLCQVPPKFLVD